ncbi:MAG TPA: DAK2 domain-containing protein [Bacilli bacterium]|nr:DAK2 domain-containing protein [Bacilli bacterium]
MKTINGITLKEMFISGANHLYNNYPAIDALNVFPVPDGDTGMNMNLTVSSGAKEIVNSNNADVSWIAKAFSKGLLMGARGNSGVITSQIFRGFAQGIGERREINAVELSDAMLSGKEVAYKAVMRPVEGTMLTVIREAAEVLADNVDENWSVIKAFEFLLKEAQASLERTPDLLPILKEVGVVDSGGMGVVVIFEGMLSALKGKIIPKETATAVEALPQAPPMMAGAKIEHEAEYGYCTEFILRLGAGDEVKKQFNEKRFANVLNSQGDSIVIVRDEDIVKVHIHTLKPGNTLTYAQQFGEFVTLKIDNMTEQHDQLQDNAHGQHFLTEMIEEKPYALISVASGEGLVDLFKEYRVDYVVEGGQTMNPSTEDFIAAIKQLNAKDIFIFPNNGNIILAATQASEVMLEEGGPNVHVIATKTIPQGLTAAMSFNPDVSVDENKEVMLDAIDGVETGQITFAIKDTTVNGVEVKKDYYMAIKGKEILYSVKNKFSALRKLLKDMIDDIVSIVTIIYGEDVKEAKMNEIQTELEELYPTVDFEIVNGGQPVYSFIIGVE